MKASAYGQPSSLQQGTVQSCRVMEFNFGRQIAISVSGVQNCHIMYIELDICTELTHLVQWHYLRLRS